VAESIELATILLTDLVGSTRLATSVGPVRADELRDEHFDLLREGIEAHGGREVKNTGDGLMVAFTSASAAVRMLAGRSEEVEYESVSELELKGFPQPVEAFAVAWAPVAEAPGAGRWPLPSLLRSVPTISYVGRERERGLLEETRVAVQFGARRLVSISGEPGIGKSRLAAHAAFAAHGDGFAVCWGACSEELAVPYEPWIEVYAQVVENAPQAVLESDVERHGGEISRLARNLSRRVPTAPAPQGSDPETERFLLFSAVAGLLADVSASTPLCVILDDLHWGDGQSVSTALPRC